ncbi:MAG: hypothetical protein ACO2ON_01620 [Candidatus Nanopusillus sp.]
MTKITIKISYDNYIEYKQILAKIEGLAKTLNINHYRLRYLILKEFANNEKWQNELIEKLKKI